MKPKQTKKKNNKKKKKTKKEKVLLPSLSLSSPFPQPTSPSSSPPSSPSTLTAASLLPPPHYPAAAQPTPVPRSAAILQCSPVGRRLFSTLVDAVLKDWVSCWSCGIAFVLFISCRDAVIAAIRTMDRKVLNGLTLFISIITNNGRATEFQSFLSHYSQRHRPAPLLLRVLYQRQP